MTKSKASENTWKSVTHWPYWYIEREPWSVSDIFMVFFSTLSALDCLSFKLPVTFILLILPPSLLHFYSTAAVVHINATTVFGKLTLLEHKFNMRKKSETHR